MKLPFSLFLAFRYLKPRGTFVSIITLICVLGVAIGTWVLIVVISVMTGFDHELRRKILGFDAHILVRSDTLLEDWRPLDELVQKQPHIVATAPFVQGPVLVEFQGQRLAPKIRGIDPEREQRVTDIAGCIKDGAFDLKSDEETGNSDKVLIGRQLANTLGVIVGDTITVYSPRNLREVVDELNRTREAQGEEAKKDNEALRQMILPQELKVTGIFESGRSFYDSEFLLVPLFLGQELYGLEDALHGITVRTDSPDEAMLIQQQLRSVLPPNIYADTWMDMNHQIFDAVALERTVMFVLLSLVTVVAAFGITSTLITVTVQKTREIGILKALGASPGQIIWIFVTQGLVVGIVGNVLGFAAGLVTVHWRNEIKAFLARVLHIEIFPARVYQLSELPAEIVKGDLAIICASAVVICGLAALVPAYVAARLDPVKALRYE